MNVLRAHYHIYIDRDLHPQTGSEMLTLLHAYDAQSPTLWS